jgi:hypothetical protein
MTKPSPALCPHCGKIPNEADFNHILENWKKDTIDLIGIWLTVATGFVVTILPLLQFIAVCLAIAVSIKKLFFNKKKNENI